VILILGSRHDPVARSLASGWKHAAISTAEDLTQPGWRVSLDDREPQTWVAGGQRVDDPEVTGIFLRRSTVYPVELQGTHPDDRAYLAAEASAFLVAMLGKTRARVANPVCDGALGEETLRPDRWMAAAERVGLPLAPLRLQSRPAPIHERQSHRVDVVGDRVHGEVAEDLKPALTALTRALALEWASVLLDDRWRLLAITTKLAPSEESAQSLEKLLCGAPA